MNNRGNVYYTANKITEKSDTHKQLVNGKNKNHFNFSNFVCLSSFFHIIFAQVKLHLREKKIETEMFKLRVRSV